MEGLGAESPLKRVCRGDGFILTWDIWCFILAHLPSGSRVSGLVVCKKSLDLGLRRVWRPWDADGKGLFYAARNGHWRYYQFWAREAGPSRWNHTTAGVVGVGMTTTPSPRENIFFLACSSKTTQKEEEEWVSRMDVLRGLLQHQQVTIQDLDFGLSLVVDNHTRNNNNDNDDNDDARVLELLLQDERCASLTMVYLLNRCVYYGRKECVRVLLGSANVIFHMAHEPNLILFKACEMGRIDILQMLLSDGRFDPSHSESVVLRNACTVANVEVVQLLLQDGRCDAKVGLLIENLRNSGLWNDRYETILVALKRHLEGMNDAKKLVQSFLFDCLPFKCPKCKHNLYYANVGPLILTCEEEQCGWNVCAFCKYPSRSHQTCAKHIARCRANVYGLPWDPPNGEGPKIFASLEKNRITLEAKAFLANIMDDEKRMEVFQGIEKDLIRLGIAQIDVVENE